MMRLRATLGLVAAALLAVLSGGGGQAPLSALAWQVLTAVALVVVMLVPGSRRPPTLVTGAGLALAAWLALSTALGVQPSSALAQGSAWIAALAIGWTLVRAFDAEQAASGEAAARALRERVLLVTSACLLLVEILGVLGLPLGGRAGADQTSRPMGTFMDPNHLTLILLVVAAIHARWAGRTGLGRIHALVAVLASLGALATKSRLAALVVVGLLAAELIRRGATRMLLRSPRVLGAAIAVVVVAGTALIWTLASRRGDTEAYTRPAIWRAAAPAALDRPLTGLGPAGFQHAWWPYNFPVSRAIGEPSVRPVGDRGAEVATRFEKIVTTPHGEWLRIPVETGFGGALLVALFVIALVRSLPRRSELLPLAAVLAVPFLAHDFLHSSASAAWIAAAVACVLADAPASRAASSGRAIVAPGDAAFVALLLAASVFVGWRVRTSLAERALERGMPIVSLDPWRPEILEMLADRLAPEGTPLTVRALRADGALEEATRLAPRDPGPIRERARLARRAMDDLLPDEATRGRALALYEDAARLAPKDASIRVEAAAVALAYGVPAESERLATQALALEPAMTRAMAVRVVALHRLGRAADEEQARATLRAHVDLVHTLHATSDYQREILAIEPDLLTRALSDE